MLEIKNISVFFETFSLKNISLNIKEGDYLTVLGVSGAGKTVLLEAIAGIILPCRGEIFLNNKDITRAHIQNRGVGLVYQDLSLFPHLTVAANIAYPLKGKKFSKSQIREKIEQLASQTEIPHLLNRYPGTLSGGESQRVALARTLASDPQVLLLDEPLSNLDVKLKAGLRSLLRNINKTGKTIIHVTHDFMESATLSNKIAIIENGRLIQTGTPQHVFRHPETEFVARFSGIRNLFPCVVEKDNNNSGLNLAYVEGLGNIAFVGVADSTEGFVMIPQEDIILSADHIESSAQNQFKGKVAEVHFSSGSMEIIVNAGVDFVVRVSRKSYEKLNLRPDTEVWMSFKASAARFIKS